ncbi:MAG: response regulator [Bordetella sp.]|nr:MAG: response regulator [Bordetella sp.]
MPRILVVDDEVGIRELLSEILYNEGYTVEQAENALQARKSRLREKPDLVLLDIWMPDTDGVSLLKEWSSQGLLNMPVIMMSGHATIDTAVEATRIGAMDFLEKPITLQRLLKTVENSLSRSQQINIRTSNSDEFNNSFSKKNKFSTETDESSNQRFSPKIVVPHNHSGNISLDQPLREARDAFERVYFEYHLVREGHSMTRVSERTGLERTHLYRKLKQLGIESLRKRNT